MAMFGFWGLSGAVSVRGLGPQSRCIWLALQTGSESKLYYIQETGGTSSSFGLGSARTFRFQSIPDADSEGRVMPLNWEGTTVSLEVPGGIYFDWKNIKMSIRSARGTQNFLYKWDGFIWVQSGSLADLKVAGIARPRPLTNRLNRRMFNTIIEHDHPTRLILGDPLEAIE